MRFVTSVTAFLLAAALSGCAGLQTVDGGQGPDRQTLAKLVPGSTTTAQARELLGPPLRTTRLERQQRDVWEYRRYEDPFNEYHIAVQFSADGVMREVLALKDYNREPCGP
jgi:outer membrane protein assembly factor BamE (lipoprotein component of BamABCDE complex)